MALALPNSTFLHIPKCGGMWIRHAIKRAKVPLFELGQQHSHFPELLLFETLEYYKAKLVFAFIRHPLTWYQSRWAFRMKNGWQMRHPLDANCASNDFCTFVHNCLKYNPDGEDLSYCAWEFKTFIDVIPGIVRYVGRLENLADDLIEALQLAGEDFDEELLRATPVINDSKVAGMPSSQFAQYDQSTIDAVLARDAELIARYYPNGPLLSQPYRSLVSSTVYMQPSHPVENA